MSMRIQTIEETLELYQEACGRVTPSASLIEQETKDWLDILVSVDHIESYTFEWLDDATFQIGVFPDDDTDQEYFCTATFDYLQKGTSGKHQDAYDRAMSGI